MYEEFREAGDFIEEDKPKRTPRYAQTRRKGLSPIQRFILSLLFFFTMFLIGALCLLVTNRVVLPLY